MKSILVYRHTEGWWFDIEGLRKLKQLVEHFMRARTFLGGTRETKMRPEVTSTLTHTMPL
jgi:hypothetical protein